MDSGFRRVGLVVGAIAIIVIPLVGPVSAAPTPPAAYYGHVTINGDPAPSGVTIVAKIDGETRGEIETNADGTYGGPGALADKLDVTGASDDAGKTVTFEVGGVTAGTTVEWASGDHQQLNFSVQIEGFREDDGNGGGGGGGGGSAQDSSATPQDQSPLISDENIARTVTREIQDQDPDSPGTTVQFEEDESTVREITFQNNVRGQVTITELQQVPDEVSDSGDGGTVVHAVDITVSETLRTSSAAITMTVRVGQLGEAQPEEAQIAHRDEAGNWNRLPTELVEIEDGQATLRGQTDGFSLFGVVVGQQATPPPTEMTETATEETDPTTATPTLSTETAEGLPGFGFLVSGIAFFLIVVFSMVRRR